MRPIDADVLLEHIKDLPMWWADAGGVYGPAVKYPEGMFYPEDIISSIENAPTFTPPNEPLTIEQLREMDGEPVYMVDLTGGTLWNQWIIFECHTNDGFIPRGGGWFGCASYGEKWLAFRRPPERQEET